MAPAISININYAFMNIKYDFSTFVQFLLKVFLFDTKAFHL
ncbi:hypothetical protein SAMN05660816_04832 [Niastella yeongjuensis]|nr:hypothetical protein SAMN05660816_04832 [Niastella yeongjuensis]